MIGERQSTSIYDAITCPFCGGWPTVEPWHGGGPRKHMVSCDNDQCHVGPNCTGRTKKQAIDRWNRRVCNNYPRLVEALTHILSRFDDNDLRLTVDAIQEARPLLRELGGN